MRIRHFSWILGSALLLSACGKAPAELDTEDQQASYGIGLDIGNNLKVAQGRLDMAAFMKGVEDAMAGTTPALADSVVQTALQSFSQSIMEQQRKERDALAETNKTEGEQYLAENAKKAGVTTTASGLQYEVLNAGTGPKPTADQQVRVHYKGMLLDGKEFDSSYGKEPVVFPVTGLIPGFSEALQLMNVGSKFRVVIPADIAYGDSGAGEEIGPNATLMFEIELLEIVPPASG